jgi:N-acetylglucosamine-6-phosphate deacetylase
MKDGFYRNPEGNLAGGAISMPEAVKNAMQYLRIPLQEAVEMGTSCVSRAIGM